ncbi:MAG: FAD-dependent oxidoreductase, partial [Chloroflexota bacterium]
MAKRVLIIGGVAGGASAAARLRRLDEQAEIILIERGEHISYANCGLPYYVGGTIRERSRLFVATPQLFNERFAIEVRTRTEAVAIDREAQELELHDLTTGRTYREHYDYLILSPGAAPVKPRSIPGLALPNVHTLRNVPDADALYERVVVNKARAATIVGGGMIGLETAENLIERGVAVNIVEAMEQVFPPIDREMAALVHEHLRDKGVRLYLGDALMAVEPLADGRTVAVLKSGTRLESDFVVVSIGVRPEVALAKAAGLELGVTGGILVDAQMRTSDPHILAVGDAVETTDFVTGAKALVPMAGPANRMGRLAAGTIAGQQESYRGTIGTVIAKVFDLAVAATGKNEAMLAKAGQAYQSCVIHPGSHAGYYPGADTMTLKILFAPDGRLLGAQAVGRDGVDKRIDVLATAIAFGANVRDLQHLELAYAPPFGSAKDPVNMAGFTAGNILDGSMPVCTWRDVPDLISSGALLLDVREPSEYELGHADGAVSIPLGQLRARINEVPHDRPVVVYCQVGLRAYVALRMLMQNGYDNVVNLSGGYRTYRAVADDLKAAADPGAGVNRKGGPAISSAVADDGTSAAASSGSPEAELDASGLSCPGPIMAVFQAMTALSPGQILRATATDPGFKRDIAAWCGRTGNELVSLTEEDRTIIARIRKGGAAAEAAATAPRGVGLPTTGDGQDKTIVVFSGDLDRALASFVIATGAAALGRKVTMFFTFWGLNVLRRPEPVPVKKSLIDRMFGMM